MRIVDARRLTATAALLALAACGASAKPAADPSAASEAATPSATQSLSATESPTPQVSSTPTASPSRFREAYANALEDYLAAYTRADETGNPASPDLDRYSTGAGLAWARKQVTDHVKLGVAHKGYWQFRHLGAVDVTSSSARVGQCMDWSNWPVLNRTTGVSFQRFAAWSQLVYADMILQGGQWKVSMIQVQAGAC